VTVGGTESGAGHRARTSSAAGSFRRDLLYDPRWADGRVETSAASRPAMAWAAAIIWNAVAATLLVVVFPELWAEGSPFAWGILLFALPGLHLFVHAALVTARWRRFGSLTLHLDPFPGSLGGHVGGWVELPLGRQAMGRTASESRFRVTVSCIRRERRERSSGSNSTSEKVVWTQEVEPEVARRGRGLDVRFAVEVPEGLPATDVARSDGGAASARKGHAWAVRIVGEMPGADFDQSFDVPVVDSGEARLAAGTETSPSTRGEVRRGELPRSVVRIHPDARGLRFHYPLGRDPYAGVMLTLFGAVFGGAGVFLAAFVVADFAAADFFGIFFGGVGAVVALAFAGVGLLMFVLGLFTLTNSLEVRIGAGDVTTRRKLLGIPVSTRSVPTDSLTGIRMKVTGQTGQGVQARVRYSIVGIVEGPGDERHRRIALGDGLPGPGVADAVAARIEEATGVAVVHRPTSARSPSSREG